MKNLEKEVKRLEKNREKSIMEKKTNNLEKIKEYLKTEKINAVHIGNTTRHVFDCENASYPVLTIETKKHTIILTLEAYNYLNLKDYIKPNW